MSPQAPNPSELIIRLPDGKSHRVVLERDRYELGRTEANALCFPDVTGLSRKHAVFERSGKNWIVRDLGSTNGTFVNGNRLEAGHTLRSNDRIGVGDLSIVFIERSTPDIQTVVFIDSPSTPAASAAEATLQGVVDAEKEMHADAHMKALIHAGRELAGHTSLEELFGLIMSLMIDASGASRGVLMTIEEEGLRVRASKGAGFRISSHVRDVVLRQKRSLLVQDALADADLAGRMSIVEDQIRSILAVPLETEDRVIGLIYLDAPGRTHEFTREDLSVLTVLANIAAIRIEHARLAEIEQAEQLRNQELEHATLIQNSILPTVFPPFPGRREFELHAAMVPAREVGGDFFDFFLLDDEHLGFVVGDVSGKGVPAALFMSVCRTLLRATAQHQTSPGDCFTYVNQSLADQNVAGMYVTLCYCVLNTRTGDLEYANGGHLLPYIFSADGKFRQPARSGPLVGMIEGHRFVTKTDRIAPGEAILLYTDGVTEARDVKEQFFEEKNLEAFVVAHAPESARQIVQNLHQTIQDFAKGAPQADDITVLALRYLG
ncbi:MAG: SpoIIE family protein phosphatase [Bryobacteraceae bacterium]|jgi:serine phosphatase RsbU (regulator of sigma subunit)